TSALDSEVLGWALDSLFFPFFLLSALFGAADAFLFGVLLRLRHTRQIMTPIRTKMMTRQALMIIHAHLLRVHAHSSSFFSICAVVAAVVAASAACPSGCGATCPDGKSGPSSWGKAGKEGREGGEATIDELLTGVSSVVTSGSTDVVVVTTGAGFAHLILGSAVLQ
ncbi:hypothetical protein PFISCL1PPCAC_881, partial [Pristionchus fissidentatus]